MKRRMADKSYSNFEEFILSITQYLEEQSLLSAEWVAALAATLGMDVIKGSKYKFLKQFLGGGKNWADQLFHYSTSEKMEGYLDIVENTKSEFDEIFSVMATGGILKVGDVAYMKMDLYELIRSIHSSTL